MQERHVIHQRCVYLSCQSLGSSTAHLTAALASFVFSVFSLSPWLRTAIHHSLRFFHLCVLCSPLIYCWTCLQNGPGAFHSVKKEKRKESSSEWEKHIQKQRKQQFNMHMNSAQWDPAYASELSRWHFVCDAWSSTVTAPLTWFTFDYLKQNRKSTRGE